MGFFGWLRPRISSPRLRLVVFGTEEILPLPLQLAHPDGLWGALLGIPSIPGREPGKRIPLELPMEPGNYLFTGAPGEVLASVEQRSGRASYPGRDQRGSAGAPAGMSDLILERLENARWAVTLDLISVASEVWDAVLYQVELADRLAALSGGVLLDQVSHRYCLPGAWRVANAIRPIDAREHVVIHLEIGDRRTLWVHTHGLVKFRRPELEILDLPEPLGEPACRLLIDLAQGLIGGAVLRPGGEVGDPHSPMVVKLGRDASASHYGGPSLELVDAGHDGRPAKRGATRGVQAYRQPSWSLPAGAS